MVASACKWQALLGLLAQKQNTVTRAVTARQRRAQDAPEDVVHLGGNRKVPVGDSSTTLARKRERPRLWVPAIARSRCSTIARACKHLNPSAKFACASKI